MAAGAPASEEEALEARGGGADAVTSVALPVAARLPRGLRAVSWIAIFLGLLGAWIALPPISSRSWVWSLVFCLIAVMLGIGVIIRGERRFGGYAVAAGVLGFALAYSATLSGVGKLETVVVWSALLASTLRYATPLIFAAMGGMFSERSGVTNIGLEGMMLMGAFFGILGSDKFGQWYYGLILAIVAGGLMALLHAVLSIQLRADQIVGGTAINFLALGLTGYLFIDIYGQEGTPTDISSIPQVNLGFLDDVPFFGTVFGHLNLMIWVALLLIPIASVILFKTPLGLRIRAVGEHPRAADTVGISVYSVRYGAVVLSGMLAACGGAYLSIGFVNSFNENMTAGRGFIALAAVIFGNWRPWGAAAACLLFGFSSALAQRLPEYSDSAAVLFQALPYVLTLIAVAGVIGRSIPPAAVGRPYRKS
jgi:general nucleoside transport system permease protein